MPAPSPARAPRTPLALALLLAAAGLAGCAEDAAGVPHQAGALAVGERLADFGTVFEGRVLEHEWTVEVRAPVAVAEAKTDCGCTLAQLARVGAGGGDRAAPEPYVLGTPLAPGERLLVRARYDTRGGRGAVPRSITLLPTDGAPLALTLSADVRPWLVAEPAELAYERVLEGTSAARELEVRAVSGERFGLRATRSALPPWVTVELRPRDPDDAGRATRWHVAITLGAEAPRNSYSYPIELETDVAVPGSPAEAPRRFTLAPRWTLQVVGPVALSAPALEFGVVGADETVARTVRLDSFDPAFQPSAARARLEPLVAGEELPLARTASVHARPAGRSCEIELTLAGLDPGVTGQFLAKLVVETGHPDLPRLDALVRGVRAPSAGPGTPR